MLDLWKGSRSGGVSDDEQIVRVRGWLLEYLRPEEQDALCRLWMFKVGLGLEAAQAMLVSSKLRAAQAALTDMRAMEHAFGLLGVSNIFGMELEAAEAMLGSNQSAVQETLHASGTPHACS